MTGIKGKKIRPRHKIKCERCGRGFSSPPNGKCPFCDGPLTQEPPIGKSHDAKKPPDTPDDGSSAHEN